MSERFVGELIGHWHVNHLWVGRTVDALREIEPLRAVRKAAHEVDQARHRGDITGTNADGWQALEDLRNALAALEDK